MIALPSETKIKAACDSDEELQALIHDALTVGYYNFSPRPDDTDEFDEQSAFVDRNYVFDENAGQYAYDGPERFKICLGGNGSGKTHGAAFKVACHVLETPPPRDRCPFWVIGEFFDQTCQATWAEKLAEIIPESEILDIDWYKVKRNWPKAVILRHPQRRNDPGWVLEFKSYEQGLSGMKAVSIGGYWFNEEVPYHMVFEVQRGCRDYDSPGWADFTPIECRDPEWPEAYDDPPQGWRFYHLNSLKNTALADGFMERYLSTVPEDMRELRTIGKFTTLKGAVFKEFRKSIHVIEPIRIPRDWRKIRGLDFGFNNPFCCLWIARDHDDRWYVYDEHYEPQRLIAYHSAAVQRRDWDSTQPWYGPTYSDHDPQIRAELAQYGINTTLANKSEAQGIEMLRSLMMSKADGKPQLFIFSHCRHLISEIQGARYPEGTSARNPADVPLDKDNHAIDALRYAIYTDRAGVRKLNAKTLHVKANAAKHGLLAGGVR